MVLDLISVAPLRDSHCAGASHLSGHPGRIQETGCGAKSPVLEQPLRRGSGAPGAARIPGVTCWPLLSWERRLACASLSAHRAGCPGRWWSGEAGGQLTSKTEPTPGESSPASRRCGFLLTGRLLSLLVRLLKAKRFTLPYKYHLPALNKTAAGPRGQA